MRMRLGILHDTTAQERMHAREAAEAAAKKKQSEKPTVMTEAEQKAADEEAAKDKDKDKDKDKKEKTKEKPKPPAIRPLSDARAIELGANFIAEGFIFAVAVGLLVFERWWSRRKENKKDEHVVERLQALEEQKETISYLEAEVARLRAQNEAQQAQQTQVESTKKKQLPEKATHTKKSTSPSSSQSAKRSAKAEQ